MTTKQRKEYFTVPKKDAPVAEQLLLEYSKLRHKYFIVLSLIPIPKNGTTTADIRSESREMENLRRNTWKEYTSILIKLLRFDVVPRDSYVFGNGECNDSKLVLLTN